MESAVNESAHPVTDGVLKTDAGALFGKMPKTRWSRLAKPDRKHRVALDLNVLLLRKENGRGILIDAGLGAAGRPRAGPGPAGGFALASVAIPEARGHPEA